ncbi:MAG: hypothetical protein L6Q95_10335 [Planctomycetes bacterium]|nr:hypothetical protein [Planctomycetota bacterium]
MTVAELVAHLSDRGIVLGARGADLYYRGPDAAVTADVLDALRARKAEILDLLRRDRFAPAELDALGFLGTGSAGHGMIEVEVRGTVEVLILRLGLFDVEPEIRGDELWLVGRTPADDPEAVLPPKLLAEAKARAEEIDRYVRAKGTRDG